MGNSKIKTRFAPSPTGYLHVGNLRTALINFLYSYSNNGSTLLRIDDTDVKRVKQEYIDGIFKDLDWLGLEFNDVAYQSARLDRYEQAKEFLIKSGRLYPCYETQEEIAIKRKFQLSRGLPPIYDRQSLNLSEEAKQNYIKQGRRPHYRFLIQDEEISWHDMIKGKVTYQGSNLSDPIIIREDGSLTYMLSSTVDDIDHGITHVVRGDDHVSNTAIQIQMFNALNDFNTESIKIKPEFGHVGLIKAKDGKISKRLGGFSIQELRDVAYIEPATINSFFAFMGSNIPQVPCRTIQQLVEKFDISKYSSNTIIYMPDDLSLMNKKIMNQLTFSDINNYLIANDLDKKITQDFWEVVQPNIYFINELSDWYEVCYNPKIEQYKNINNDFINTAIENLPKNLDENSWKDWTKIIKDITGVKGKELFMNLRLMLTGKEFGPEMSKLLTVLTREDILNRLQNQIRDS